jgi:FkbM family methyltransferase
MVTTPMGPKMQVNYSDFVEREIANGTYEKGYVKLFLETLKLGDTVIDVGANVGYFSLLASEKVGRTGRVYAFEPAPRTFRRLLKNLELNESSNVKAVAIGLSDLEGTESLRVPRENPGEASLADRASSEIFSGAKYTFDVDEIKLVPFDKFCTEEGLSKIDVIKIDAEGSEFRVLRGMERALRSQSKVSLFIEISPLMIEQVGGSVTQLVLLLKDYGFYEAFAVEKGLRLDVRKLEESSVSSVFGTLPSNYQFQKVQDSA